MISSMKTVLLHARCRRQARDEAAQEQTSQELPCSCGWRHIDGRRVALALKLVPVKAGGLPEYRLCTPFVNKLPIPHLATDSAAGEQLSVLQIAKSAAHNISALLWFTVMNRVLR